MADKANEHPSGLTIITCERHLAHHAERDGYIQHTSCVFDKRRCVFREANGINTDLYLFPLITTAQFLPSFLMYVSTAGVPSRITAGDP
jgi:hypothetical protein